MASATSSHASPDPFDLGVHTPQPRAISPCISASTQFPHCEPSHWSHIRVSATGGDAVLAPYQTLQCRRYGRSAAFAEQFSNSFLDFWKQALSDLNSAPAPTYSSVAAGRPGRPIPAPPKEDLRVFVRLDAEAPARDHSSYAIRTHIAAKVGIDLHRVPAAFKVNSGWAIRTTDATIRDLIVQRQSEWSEDLDATSGNEVNYEAAVKDEIACQTGLTPISIRPSRHDSSDLPTVTDNRPASVAEGTAMTVKPA
ncbi:endonuclease-reverse transcriptase domain-containing protein [Hirsutella rhossiliensis]